jgi:transposase
MMKRLEAFEYIRNGTMNVLAFLCHADGKVYAECQADHKTDTLVAVFKRHVASCPINEQLHYVMDNLSTHTCYGYCEAVAALSHVACPDESELNTLQKRVSWLKSANKRVVIHFTPYHGSWLNMVEHWFGIMNQKVLKESFGSAEALQRAFEAFLALWNDLMAHPFNWRYDGKGLHDKAIKRFTQMLEHSAATLENAMLTKQLRLMKNLFDDYNNEIDENLWQKMTEALESQHSVLEKLIEDEKGPVRTKKAACALTSMMQLIRPEYNCIELMAA